MGSALPLACERAPAETAEPFDAAFIESFERNARETIARFGMIAPDDKVLVAVSGGKDSLATLHLLKKFGYTIEAVTIDVHIGCYTAENLANVKRFCASQDIKLHVFDFRTEYGASVCYLTDVLKEKGEALGTCTVCGVLRRRLLNQIVRECGATKVATGHNLDDEAQSHIMNMVRNRPEQSMRLRPVSGDADDGLTDLVPRIKPLCMTRERDVVRYTKMLQFPVHYGRCPCSKDSMRSHVRALIEAYEAEHPDASKNVLETFVALQRAWNPPSKKDVKQCRKCGEPSSGALCRACSIVAKLESPAQGA